MHRSFRDLAGESRRRYRYAQRWDDSEGDESGLALEHNDRPVTVGA